MRRSLQLAAAATSAFVVALSAAAIAGAVGSDTDGDGVSDAAGWYTCIPSDNKLAGARSYPLNGWHGNTCPHGQTRVDVPTVKGMQAAIDAAVASALASAGPTAPPATAGPTATPTTTAPTTAAPTTTAPPTTSAPTTAPPTTTAPPAGPPTTGPANGWPDASNTGVQPGITLTPGICPGTITTPGTVIENKTFTNCTIRVQASNVTIRNSRLLSTQLTVWDDQPKGDITGIVLDHLDVDGQMHGSTKDNDYAVGGGLGGGFALTNSNIHGWDTGIMVNAHPANVIIRGNYVHDLGPASGVHKTAMSSNGGGGNAVVDHNNLDCNVSGCSAAFSLYGDNATISGWTVSNNLFNTEGSYCTYGGTLNGKKYPTADHLVWTGNVYGRAHNPQCGQYGPNDGWSGNGSVWTGNTWADTGATVNP